jgi:serine/threonine protein kinase
MFRLPKGVFVKFKNDNDLYAWYRKDFEQSYNKVVVDDFDYMGIIGHGGFGRVVHVRKRSTGIHYAMKIQPKTELLAEYKGDEDSLQTEKTVFAQCHHPFVVDMAYAIQTDSHAILVLGLVRGGDLEDAIKAHGRLSEERTWLYSAEILLALQHMHDLGLLYRDLKPCNVLLGDDGHIQVSLPFLLSFLPSFCPFCLLSFRPPFLPPLVLFLLPSFRPSFLTQGVRSPERTRQFALPCLLGGINRDQ